MILQQSDQRCASTSSRRPARRGNGGKVGQKRKKNDDVADKMEKYLELKTKQVEEENDFSIKNCNALLSRLEGLSGEERADAYDIFKDVQNREIFMTAEPSSRLIWLRKKIVCRTADMFTYYYLCSVV
uniref:Uncharacterized protein n=1 Tax=Arundo donax TaxID=35708 RepID=A0A0A9E465_ARUDO